MKSRTSILVVDDDPEVLAIHAMLLREEGYAVREASSGLMALQMIYAHRPDLVLLDVMLPDVSGLKVCRQIKTDPSLLDVFVVLCSGTAMSPSHKADGLEGGADDYLSKPVGVDEFRARIRNNVRLRDTTVALRSSEQHYRRLVEILPEAVGLTDARGRLLSVNSQAVAMLGYGSKEELLGKRPSDLIPPENDDIVWRHMANCLKTGAFNDVECILVRKDGTRFPAELSAAVLKKPHGPPRIVIVVRDITQRKRAAEILTASNERFRQLAENIDDVFWIKDITKNKLLYVSPGYEKIWGSSVESLLASPSGWLDSVHTEDRARIREAVRSKQISGTYNEEYRIVRKDGSERWIQDRAFPVKNAPGDVCRVVGIAEDITKRKQAEEAVRSAEAKYRTIVDNATEGIFRCTPDGRYLTANPALALMMGYQSPEELIASATDVAMQAHIMKSSRPDAKRRSDNQTVFEGFEAECRRKDGRKIWRSINGRAVFNERGSLLYHECTCQDVTARKLAEEELRQLSQRIIEAGETERLRVAREIHDGVNQTIASAKMRLRNVQAALGADNPAAREILARCEKLLVQALEENRRIAHNLHPTILDDLGLPAACRALCQELHARTNLTVKSYIAPLPQRLSPTIELNLFRIVQEAFNNIEKHARAKSVHIRLSERAGSVSLMIKDDGRGFVPFRSNAGKGTRSGIGLRSLRERAALLGGTSEFRSTLKHGTTISVKVPNVTPK